MGLVGLLLVVVGFWVYGIWRYQVWLPLVANDAGLSISNPENVPIKLASGRTIDDFLDLFPEAAKKKKVVLEFHPQMPEENNCGGPKKLDRKTGSLRGYPAPVEPPARRLQTRPVSGIPTMNGCVYDYTHPR